ncbi:MAG: DUF86 domain-containing protein [Cytophagaceae bacterium]|nr:DUF86 domain-containing protein [Cytophagaceae bacterium]
MTEAVKKWLFDVQTSIEAIESYLGESRDFNEYRRNQMLRRAVEREFEIIGEAINRIRKSNEGPEIRNASKIVVLRNQIIHAYDNISDEIIWGIIDKYLPALSEEIKILLGAPLS